MSMRELVKDMMAGAIVLALIAALAFILHVALGPDGLFTAFVAAVGIIACGLLSALIGSTVREIRS